VSGSGTATLVRGESMRESAPSTEKRPAVDGGLPGSLLRAAGR
jgi:hypothetical protein